MLEGSSVQPGSAGQSCSHMWPGLARFLILMYRKSLVAPLSGQMHKKVLWKSAVHSLTPRCSPGSGHWPRGLRDIWF